MACRDSKGGGLLELTNANKGKFLALVNTMKTDNFTRLVQSVTGRPFTLSVRDGFRDMKPAGEEIACESQYFVGYTLPLSGRLVGFDWKTAKSDEKMLRSFITAFTSKYREPDPVTYVSDPYGAKSWDEMNAERREGAFGHHVSHMLTKEKLLEQVKASFALPEMEASLIRWGFYETEYGIGIFSFWLTASVNKSIQAMRAFLANKGISAREEFSDARWVYRFRVEASKEIHRSLLTAFNATPTP